MARAGRPWRLLATVVVAANFAAAISGAVLLFPVREVAYEATVRAVIVPVNLGKERPYHYDVAARRVVGATYAAIVGNRRFQNEAADLLSLRPAARRDLHVTVRNPPSSTVLALSVRSPDPEVALAMARVTMEQGRDYIDSLRRLFVLRTVRPPRAASRVVVVHHRPIAAALLVGTLASLPAFGLARAATGRRSRRTAGVGRPAPSPTVAA